MSILSLVTFLGLKSILSDINITTLTYFWLPFAWSIIFHPLLWPMFVFRAEMGLLKAAYSWVLFPLIQPTTLCLLIGKFSSFTLRMVIDICVLFIAILSFVGFFWWLCVAIVSFPLCVCLLLWFCGFLWFFPFCFLFSYAICLSSRFLFCSYHYIYAKKVS